MNKLQQTINYIVYEDHLGDDNTSDMNSRYIEAVKKALGSEYPIADIEVELKSGSGFSNGYASGFEDDDQIITDCHQTANQIWERADY